MRRNPACLALVLLLPASGPLAAAESDDPFFFRKGDRIVFLGDSVTKL
jgi:hypothetical protein